MALALFETAYASRGFSFPPDACELRARGANTVLLPVLVEQWGLAGTELEWSREGIGAPELRGVIRRARDCGMQTVITPLVEVRGGDPSAWRGRLRPRDPEAWWAAYEEVLLPLASLAEEEGVDAFVVSHELGSLSTSRTAHRWRVLAARVRSRYSGRLAVVVNHDALDARLPFESFDLVGVSAYFPLASSLEPDRVALREGWARARAQLAAFADRVDRPIVLFEVGYPSLDGAVTAPWDGTLGAPIDLEEQALAYDAAVDAIEGMPFVDGALFWAWGGPGGPHDRSFTPRGKPAERHLRRYLSGARVARWSRGP